MDALGTDWAVDWVRRSAAVVGEHRAELSGLDRAIGAVSRLGIALPSFWLAMLLLLVFAVRLHWLDASGFPGWEAGMVPALLALLLPVFALALPQSPTCPASSR